MNDLVKEYMETGKDLNSICDDKIKENNRQWFLILLIVFFILGGYTVGTNIRAIKAEQAHSKCDSIHKVDSLTIDMQYKTLNSAVYFEDIK